MNRFTVLSSYPANRSCANVGDQLIEVACKQLVEHELGPCEFLTFFREDPLDAHIDAINETQAVLMPAFPIRDTPMYPGCYQLTKDLDRIKVPLVPVGANWNVYPGDAETRRWLQYSDETVAFLRRVAAGVDHVSCREYFVCDVLKKHGVSNTLMTGDPAWYDPEFLGRALHRPDSVDHVVFTPPLSAFYRDQAGQVLRMMADLFPDARRYCAMHLTDVKVSPFPDKRPTNDASMRPDVADKNAYIRRLARDLGFEILEFSGDVTKLAFYGECDLHIGYECHAHLSFLRQRRPSVLIAEDARGVGFNYTLGVGGFTGFRRAVGRTLPAPKEGGTSGYCVTQEEFDLAPARDDIATEVRQFVEQELASGFRRYLGVAGFIDETYEHAMAPFIRSLPGANGQAKRGARGVGSAGRGVEGKAPVA